MMQYKCQNPSSISPTKLNSLSFLKNVPYCPVPHKNVQGPTFGCDLITLAE